MFNLLKKKSANLINPVSQAEIVEKIHVAFDTAGDRLLAEAKEYLAIDFCTEKGERLKNLGFTKSQPAIKHTEVEAEKLKKKGVAESIEHFRLHYPNNKFITKEVVEQICAKYGLVLGPIDAYKGDVPLKNIEEMEAFKMREEDMEKIVYSRYRAYQGYIIEDPNGEYYGYKVGWHSFITAPADKTHHFKKEEFVICGPEKEFDMTHLKKVGFSLVDEDPIVLQPVKNGFLIVSKWGIEASDNTVINEGHN